ncbi:MAG TPA: ABC transporter permease [Gemmatimonadaceae bacterium]|nr:ABC transporter permease [Gemmatimonadaceae bacterium]
MSSILNAVLDLVAGARERLRALVHRGREERELEAELRFHLEMEVEKNVGRGMSPEEARRRALVAFGGVERFKDEVRDARGLGRLEDSWRDLRLAARSLRRSPGFTVVAVLALALGIGANTAVFSVVNGVLLAPLPYPDPERLVYLGWDWGNGDRIDALTPLQFEFWREQSRVLEGAATYKPFRADLSATADRDEIDGLRVSADFFRVLGVRPALGRAFAPEETAPGGRKVAVLSDAFWRRRFGADSAVVGRTLRLDADVVTIVGVMPPHFRVVGADESDELLVPLQRAIDPGDEGHNDDVLARLRPGVTPEQLAADLARVMQAFRTTYPDLVEAAERGIYTSSPRDHLLWGMQELQRTLWILLGATLFVLLIACVDVANLLLARATGRQREIATRVALGAGRGRIVRQLLTESLLLGLVAGASGLLIGVWSLHALLAATPWSIPRADEIGLDGRVLAFTLLISLVTAMIFGLTSAVSATRPDLAGALREGGRSGESSGRRRTRNVFVVAETAVSLVLLTGAGLLIASFGALRRIDPGFDATNVLTVGFERAPDGYDRAAQAWRFERQALARLRALPGVTAAAGTSIAPLQGQWNIPMTVEGRPEATRGAVQTRAISPGYFRTMAIPLVRGRAFTDADAAGASPVIVISQALADHFWPDGDALGQRILVGVFEGKNDPEHPAVARQVVGIVSDTRDLALDRAPWPTVYLPQAQMPDGWTGLPSFVLRTRGPATPALRAAVTRALRDVDPRLEEPEIRPMRELLASSIAEQRFTMQLMALLAGLALSLTAIGIYGVVAYSVGRRQQEIGVRMALGAQRGDVLRLVVRQGMHPVLLGLGLGLVAAAALTRYLASMLYGVGARDPLTFGGVALVLAAVAALASYLPARRATRVAPIVTLRAE